MVLSQKFLLKLKTIFLHVLLSVSFLCVNISLVFANVINADVSAIKIAKLIESKNLIEVIEVNTEKSSRSVAESLNDFTEIISQGDKEKRQVTLSRFEKLVKTSKHQDAYEILEIYKKFLQLNTIGSVGGNYEEKFNYLINIESRSWFVNFHIQRLLAIVHSTSRKSDLALQTASRALALIPNDLSDEAINARIIATELIAFLQNVNLNKKLAVVNTQRLIDLKLAAGQTIDGIELINNLMFSHSAWRDDEIRLALAQTLKRLEDKYGSTTPGLSSHHIARVYNDIGDYKNAKLAAQDTLKTANLDSLLTMGKINLATAQAGLGEIEEAKAILNSLPDTANGRYTIPYARTLIALNEGRTDDALKLMNERYDTRVRSLLEEKTNNTAEILASLSNSSERQAEREEALQREAYLVQSRLEQQQKINTLLIGLISLLLFGGVVGALLARHRHKLAHALILKTKEAASADKMKTEFLGMMSHELRTPLNGIIGLADVMVQQGPTDQVKERAEIILSSGNELFNVIEGIIDMSRIEGNKLEILPEPTSITEIAHTICEKWEASAKEKSLNFTYYIADKQNGLFDVDPVRLEKCIDTLLSNAIKFTDTGQVHLHLTCEDNCDEARETGTQNFTIIVADTGQGMNEEVQSKLFKPFLQADISMTRKHGGSGLRLAIARATARMMEGDITVYSRDGKGSEFTFTFEATPAVTEQDIINITPPDSRGTNDLSNSVSTENTHLVSTLETTLSGLIPADRMPDTPNLLRQYSVLVVTGGQTCDDIVHKLLQPFGANCVVAETPDAGLKALTVQAFDCLILDINTPEAETITFLETIRKNHGRWSEIPVLALMDDASAENNAACMAAGADIFLAKPVAPSDLKDVIVYLRAKYKISQAGKQRPEEKRRA